MPARLGFKACQEEEEAPRALVLGTEASVFAWAGPSSSVLSMFEKGGGRVWCSLLLCIFLMLLLS